MLYWEIVISWDLELISELLLEDLSLHKCGSITKMQSGCQQCYYFCERGEEYVKSIKYNYLFKNFKVFICFFSSAVNKSTIWPLSINIALLCSFMFQHSVMAKTLLKKAIYSSTFQVIERSIYVLVTSFTLQVSI